MAPSRLLPRGCFVVSCQARIDNPLHGPLHMAAMARAAVAGGAGAIRANGEADVAAIRAAVEVPLIGLRKRLDTGLPVYITPGFSDAALVGMADVIAVDATGRARDGEASPVLIARIRAELGREVLADVATCAEALAAEQAGASYVATTLAGYTEDRPMSEGPDFALLAELLASCRGPVVAEGRFETPDQVARAFAMGAHAVVVGTAITNPREITRRFTNACDAAASPLPLREGPGKGVSQRDDVAREPIPRSSERTCPHPEPLPLPLPQGEGRRKCPS